MRRWFAVYAAYIRLQLLVSLEYRVDLLLGLIGISALNVVDVALIGVILSRFEFIGGWSFWEIAFLTFFYLLVLGIENLFAVHILDIEDYIRSGTFDRFLVRPIPPLLQLLGQDLNMRYLDHLILGGVGIGIAYVQLGLQWSTSLSCCSPVQCCLARSCSRYVVSPSGRYAAPPLSSQRWRSRRRYSTIR
jgi:ABC-2 type transport system permease protein